MTAPNAGFVVFSQAEIRALLKNLSSIELRARHLMIWIRVWNHKYRNALNDSETDFTHPHSCYRFCLDKLPLHQKLIDFPKLSFALNLQEKIKRNLFAFFLRMSKNLKKKNICFIHGHAQVEEVEGVRSLYIPKCSSLVFWHFILHFYGGLISTKFLTFHDGHSWYEDAGEVHQTSSSMQDFAGLISWTYQVLCRSYLLLVFALTSRDKAEKNIVRGVRFSRLLEAAK